MPSPLKNSSGFTLMEIMVTITLVGIVFAAVTQSLNPAKLINTTNDSRRKSDLKSIQVALESYKTDKGDYPTLVSNNWCVLVSDSTLNTELSPRYIKSIPHDPKSVRDYIYWKSASGAYRIYAALEGSSPTPNIISVDGGSTVCIFASVAYNYKVESP